MGTIITEESISRFAQSLREEEKAKATIEKYTSCVRKLMLWLDRVEVAKQRILEYREYLLQSWSAKTVNGALSSINSWLKYSGIEECRVKHLKVQRKVFCSARRELSREEYERLITKAGEIGDTKLLLAMETLCATGIRVGEAEYITVEAAEKGCAEITLKGKNRTILLPGKLCCKLREYAKNCSIDSGPIFRTKNGDAMSRKLIWAKMKKLSDATDVDSEKVFPHNLRHLFARCFYNATHDVAKLADMLGHSSMETTRIYLATSGEEHVRVLDRLSLVS